MMGHRHACRLRIDILAQVERCGADEGFADNRRAFGLRRASAQKQGSENKYAPRGQGFGLVAGLPQAPATAMLS
jgi:hypothetical protein